MKNQKIKTKKLEIRWGGRKITFSNNKINNNNENKQFDFTGWGMSKMLISQFQDNFSSHKNQKGSETKFETKLINLDKVGTKHSSITMHNMEITDLF